MSLQIKAVHAGPGRGSRDVSAGLSRICLAAGALVAAACTTVSDAPTQSNAVKTYTDADIAYGRQQQARIDAARDASRDPAISKAPMAPFHIVGDLYFVGVHNFGAYLIKTPEGVILIDTTWEDTAPLVAESIRQLGIPLTDIKYILTTEAHGDHNGGTAYFKKLSGAQLWVMQGDEKAMETGQNLPAVHVDRVLRDREQLKFGGKTLTAYHIPGHTPGSTTWVWQETEKGVTYTVADVCCWFTPDNVVSDPQYPTALLRKNWDVLKSLPVDVPTPGIHTYHFDLLGKLDRLKAGNPNPWIDPNGYRGVIAAFERDFEDKVIKQTRDGPPPPRPPGPPGGGPPAGAPSKPG